MNRALRQNTELLYLLVSKELKVRYKNSVLGYLWAVANPLAFAVVYYVAFKMIMRVPMPNYSIFLLAGLFPWVWLTNSIAHATGSYRNNTSLIKRVTLPRAILPLSNVAHEMVHFCFALPVLALFVIAAGNQLFLSWLWLLPLMVLLQFALVYPVALMFALLNVYVRDVEYLVGIGLSLMFFLTPIVYPLSMVPEKYQWYFSLSPLAALIDCWRGVLLEGEVQLSAALYCLFVAAGLGVSAALIYGRTQAKLGELL